MTRPRIGITTGRLNGRAMRLANALCVLIAGGWPVTIGPGIRERFDDLDGLIIGGGVDIAARLYDPDGGEEWPHDPDRDALELAGLAHADAAGFPVLGICRGMQLLNVQRGGTLVQDLTAERPAYRNRRSVLPCKSVAIAPDTVLANCVGANALRVNALHHQAVNRTGGGLIASARETDGWVQAIEAPGPPLRLGVQWHPELLVWSRRHRALFSALVDAAREHAYRQSPTPPATSA